MHTQHAPRFHRTYCTMTAIAAIGISGFAAPPLHAELAYRTVALTGTPAPGTEPGVQFLTFTTGLNHNIMHPVIDEQGRVAFIALLAGPGIDQTNNSGIWSDRSGQLELVVRTGIPAPETEGGTIFAGVPSNYLPFPPAAAGGHITFDGELAGPDIEFANDFGTWSDRGGSIELIAREGDPAPGLAAGVTFSTVFSQGINAAGHTFVRATLAGPGISDANSASIWSDRSGAVARIVRAGDPAPGTNLVFGNGQIGSSSTVFGTAVFNGNSRLAVKANLAGAGVTAFNDEALFAENQATGALQLVVREGNPAPAMPGGVTIGGNSVSLQLQSIAFNDAGHLAFNCHVGGSMPTTTVMFSNHTGAIAPVAVPGEPAPGTNFDFGIFGPPWLNNAGHIAFANSVPEDDTDPFTPPDYGIWSDRGGALTAVVLPGDPALTPTGSMTVQSVYVVGFNSRDEILAVATLDAPGYASGLILGTPDGAWHVLAATGQTHDVAGDGSDIRTITRVVQGALADSGDAVFRLDFTDDTSAHVVARAASPTPDYDLNGDGRVDLGDFSHFSVCFAGPGQPASDACPEGMNADFDGDGDVDLADFSLFAAAISG